MRELPPFARFKQRSRLYAGRSLRTMAGQSLRHPCVFLHVPKCGGTSVSEALYATVPLHRKIGILDSPSIRRALAIQQAGRDDLSFHDEGPHADEITRFREALVLMHMAHQATLIHGHFLFSEAAWRHFGGRYRYVTILRDPVARTVSNFRMDQRTGTFTGDFDAFLDSAEGRRKALHKLRYFSGMATVAPEDEAGALALARRNIERFSLIGFLDDLPGFADGFAALFGPRPRIAHYNKADEAPFAMTDAQRDRLEALCAPDIALYHHARQVAPGLAARAAGAQRPEEAA
ncbi:sulfotransferase family 2 domain-containing protein [Paracoccus spongiarum]|uniref:Sulfotransferase family 2 domain-containing protein n=1 Tax=Paracoccus spongiarum TaxID=3064387 RepID=A0ABT9JD18_9RHOB|nr:sulfotransferase family 2 domain-containing protein [Paracoccus sp. 2205BS29-5]MDP5307515.1 sulfotransferase family 2 domain-containing protein [Paracoccus sp. 2205BS29-5]